MAGSGWLVERGDVFHAADRRPVWECCVVSGFVCEAFKGGQRIPM